MTKRKLTGKTGKIPKTNRTTKPEIAKAYERRSIDTFDVPRNTLAYPSTAILDVIVGFCFLAVASSLNLAFWQPYACASSGYGFAGLVVLAFSLTGLVLVAKGCHEAVLFLREAIDA